MNGDQSPAPEPEPRTATRELTLRIPEAQYRALEAFAARRGQSPEDLGTTWLIEAIGRHAAVSDGDGQASGIIWEGPQLGLHSYAQVNREFCLRLIGRGHELSLISPEVPEREVRLFPGRSLLVERFRRSLSRPVAAHVRHQWPPSFSPPPDGHWVIVQPWEFGSLPRTWIGPMTDLVDEIWAYTSFVRDSYISSGVPADRVHVVPLGVDLRRFHPESHLSRSRPGSLSDSSSSGGRSIERGSTSSWSRTRRPSTPTTPSAW